MNAPQTKPIVRAANLVDLATNENGNAASYLRGSDTTLLTDSSLPSHQQIEGLELSLLIGALECPVTLLQLARTPQSRTALLGLCFQWLADGRPDPKAWLVSRSVGELRACLVDVTGISEESK